MKYHYYLIISIVMWVLQSTVGHAADQVDRDSSQEPHQGQMLFWKVPKSGKAALLPDISLTGSFAGAYFRDDPVGDQAENPSRTGFNFQGIELGIQSIVDPYVRADIFIVFTEDQVEVEEAAVTTLALPYHFQIKAGKLLAQFGRENTHHLEQLNFADYSPLSRYTFGNEGFKEVGVEASVLFPLPWFSQLTAQALQGENTGNFDGTRKGDFAYLAHLTNTFDLSPTLTLQHGFSGAFGFNNTDVGNQTQIYGTDLYLRWRPSTRRGIKWQTEYMYRRQETGTSGFVTDGGLDSQLIFQIARRWETGLRFDWLGLPDVGFKQRDLSYQLTFLATEFFKLRAQYNYIVTDTTRDGHEAFLQMQFNIGPHGAHSF